MLAHNQTQILNAANLARGLGVDGTARAWSRSTAARLTGKVSAKVHQM